MITGFNHSGFVVQDIDKMIHFYRDLLGLEILSESDNIAPPEGNHTGIPGAHRYLVFVGKQDSTHRLELVHFIEPPSTSGHLERNQLGASHVCFNVENIQDLYDKLTSQGIKFVTPPIMRDLPEGGQHGICYANDPEGNWLEFIQQS